MDMDNHSPPPNSLSFAQDTPPRSDVDEILRRKRKAREYKVRWLRLLSRRRLNRRFLKLCMLAIAPLDTFSRMLGLSTTISTVTLLRAHPPRPLQASYFIEHYFYNVPLTTISNQGLLSLQTAQGKMRSISALQDMHW